jgi:branched-subunit amino acid transport protein
MELRRLEARSEGPLRGFKIMAPAVRFRLCDTDADPLLFVAVGPSHYYLVHRWGRDLHPLRALAALPLRSALHGSLTLLAFALLVAAFLPNTVIGAAASAPWWGGHRLLAALWTVMLTAGFASFAWFAFFGKFSDRAWNDPHFN